MTLQKTLFALVLMMTSTAPAQTAEPVTLDGDYLVELTIGSKVFHDQMTLKGKERPVSIRHFIGGITGTMTVPGAFTSSLAGMGSCSRKNHLCRFYFSIEAHENGQTYKVNYEAVIESENFTKALHREAPVRLTGSASLEDGKLLGEFVATKQSL